MADTRFVVVAMLRTGSTYLVDLLNSHDDIFCDNELFNPHEICRYRYNESNIEGLEYRNANPTRFWDEFFYSEFAEQQVVIGFNFMLGHNCQILDKILRNIGFKIIYLSRENKLAQYSSYKKALSTQVWGIMNRQDLPIRDKSKLKFDFRDFEQWLQAVMTFEYFFKNMLDMFRLDSMCVEYKQLLQQNTHKKICNYLGVTYKPLRAETLKQNENQILDRFLNKDDVCAYLDLIGKKHWGRAEL